MSTPNPTTPPDAAAMKTRIITHMNADHADSLTRYLEYYVSLPSHRARHARLTDLSLAWLLLSSDPSTSTADLTANLATNPTDNPTANPTANLTSTPPHHSKSESRTTHFIPLDPPLTSYTGFRQRLVDMDTLCREKLGRSDITVKSYVPPKGLEMVVWAVVLATFALFGFRGNLEGRGWVGDAWGGRQRWPGVWRVLWRVQPWVFWGTMGIHLGEAAYMDRTRLRKHSVPRLSKLWWKWILSTFVEGYRNFVRFDRLVERERRKKEKAAH